MALTKAARPWQQSAGGGNDALADLGKDVVFMIGGANGLSDTLLQRADQRMSLSALTFPHYLVRVLIAEALYRAYSICIGHPYHRE